MLMKYAICNEDYSMTYNIKTYGKVAKRQTQVADY